MVNNHHRRPLTLPVHHVKGKPSNTIDSRVSHKDYFLVARGCQIPTALLTTGGSREKLIREVIPI